MLTVFLVLVALSNMFLLPLHIASFPAESLLQHYGYLMQGSTVRVELVEVHTASLLRIRQHTVMKMFGIKL
jgi:hypothetical protein